MRTIENLKPKTIMKPAHASPHPAAYCQEPSSRVQHFVIGHFTSKAITAHMFLEVVIVVVRTVARPRHLPHCNVAMVVPCDHVQSSTVVHFLRRDSTCRDPSSLRSLPELLPRHGVFHCPGCLAAMFCRRRFRNRSRSTGKIFSPPFPNSRHCGHSAVTRHSNRNLATDFSNSTDWTPRISIA